MPFQGYYERSSNSVERNGYNDHETSFSSARSQQYYSKYNNNVSNENGYSTTTTSTVGSGSHGAGIGRNNNMIRDKQAEDYRMKYYSSDYKPNELNNLMLSNYNNQKLDQTTGSTNSGSNGGGGPGSYSGSGGSAGNGAYEDDFPELTTTKFSQLRLSPVNNHVPSTNTSDFCF